MFDEILRKAMGKYLASYNEKAILEKVDLERWEKLKTESFEIEENYKKLKAEGDLFILNIKKKYGISPDQQVEISGEKIYTITPKTIDQMKDEHNEKHDPTDI